MTTASRPAAPTAAAEIPVPVLTPATQTESLAEQAQSTPETVRLSGPAADGETTANKTAKAAEPAPPHGARERTRERLQRASSVARGAIEDNVRRVEKIHHVSTAMIEEAHYDSSLRFVLVALGLFVIFIILLILSKVMG